MCAEARGGALAEAVIGLWAWLGLVVAVAAVVVAAVAAVVVAAVTVA
jgi:uncharacterized membrane protein